MSDVRFRPFAWSDVPAITGIYRHYVEETVITFETEAPGEPEMAERFGKLVALGHPLIIAEQAGKVVGYAYASFYRPRAAYRFTCEDSIYLSKDVVGQGIGGERLHVVDQRLVGDPLVPDGRRPARRPPGRTEAAEAVRGQHLRLLRQRVGEPAHRGVLRAGQFIGEPGLDEVRAADRADEQGPAGERGHRPACLLQHVRGVVRGVARAEGSSRADS